ncbi:MAG: histidine phosphatase family protein [Solirubrobacteraceae bacterium]|nr:histidine phosphatase family protein [Solirubrobacteraceae bacterium]
MSVLLLVRHAQATFGLGTYDKLSEHGQRQATHLGETLARRAIKVDRIISGDLERQRETAELIAAALGTGPASIEPAWNEYEHLPLIARVKPAYRKQWMMVADLARSGNPNRKLQEVIDQALVAWVGDEVEDSPGPAAAREPDDVEPFSAYSGRIADALDSASQGSGTTLVVSSAGTIAAAVAPLLGIPPVAWPAQHRVMVNTGITKVVRGQRGITLISFNEHGHLEGAPDVKITYR